MDLTRFIQKMPKVELHVHLEGAVRPATLLRLARRHHIPLPADNLDGLRRWYTFRDFNHFVQIYMTIASCLRTADDIELVAREFLTGQAKQNICYSEVTFTPYNQYNIHGLGFHEQIDAVNRARDWAAENLDVEMKVIMDIPRHQPPEEGMRIAQWAVARFGSGVDAFGLGGPEAGNPPEKFREAFDLVRGAGIPCILHAGETAGPKSIWGAIQVADPVRIGHGVRAVEDPKLMTFLVETQLPLEVCPSGNVCLKVFPSLEEHPLPRLMDAGVRVTINSDDPPMFNTTLTEEFLRCAIAFGWSRETVAHLMLSAVDVTLLPPEKRRAMRREFQDFL